MKSKRTTKPAKAEQGLLMDMARTIGSTLGTLAAKTGASPRHAAVPVLAKKKRAARAGNRKTRRARA